MLMKFRAQYPLLRTPNSVKCRFSLALSRCVLSDNWVPFSPRHRDRGGDQVGQRERQQKLPSEGHELVVAEAWQRAAHPDIKKEEDENLGDEPEHRQDGLQNPGAEQRPVPAAKK